jgi:hypothetical protein
VYLLVFAELGIVNPYINKEGNLIIGNVKQYEDTETSDEKMPNS